MSRSLFDPSRMAVRNTGATPPAAPPSTTPPSAPPPLSVTQLGALIDGALRDHLPRKIRVVGEISGFNDRTHWYFSLKDAAAVVSCVMFASAARAAGFRPDNGHEVVATGRVEFFAKQGRTQFYVEKLEPVGAGALDLEFKRLCDELRALGWFDPERKRPLPRAPRRIAVVTSKTSAAYQDVLDTMRKRAPGVAISLIDVRVQGDGAAPQIASVIRLLSQRHAAFGLDAILLTRGGGSKEDLWAFNDRDLAEAIVKCSIPVVAAIGHETDVTIAELVADERCATPTQAAMRLTPDTRALFEQLDSLAHRARHAVGRTVDDAEERIDSAVRHLRLSARETLSAAAFRLERAAGGLESHRPAAIYARRDAALANVQSRLATAAAARLDAVDLTGMATAVQRAALRRVQEAGQRLDALERALELVGPASVLARGYSATLRADGAAVRSVADVSPGEVIRTIVADGSFESTVGTDRAAPLPAQLTPLNAPPSPRRRRPAEPVKGPSLFE